MVDWACADRAIDPRPPPTSTKFERLLADHLAGRVDEDAFRVFRLNNGIYGQRQGGHNQMVRIKLPYGSVTPEQLELLGSVADRYSRGWGHLTTRLNVQFHFVQLERVPDLLRELASVGLTTREACGDTVRNVMGCHLAGACPYEVLDISPWAEATFRHFLHHPYAQRLPRKFKINFSGCATDCGQAMFNDVGVVAVSRPADRTAPSSPASGCSWPAASAPTRTRPRPSRSSPPARTCCPPSRPSCGPSTTTATGTTSCGPGMKWVVDQIGIDELRRRIFRERQLPAGLVDAGPGGIPADRRRSSATPPPAWPPAIDPTPVGMPVTLRLGPRRPATRAGRSANVVVGVAKGTVSAIAYAQLGDITSEQFRALAAIHAGASASTIAGHQPAEPGVPRPDAEQLPDAVPPPGRASAWPSRAPSWPATWSPARAPTPATWP